MKISITMKNPDCVSDAIDEAAQEAVAKIEGLDEDEKEELMETKREKISKSIAKWVEYGEYITVDIDTEAGTAVVVPA